MKSKIDRKSTRIQLAKAIKMALASTLLVSGVSHAVLRDHGPSNPVVGFPDWYRDNNGLALGQCIYADDAGNGPLCLTGPADADPNGFAGNIGEEAFYATADIEIPITGGSFMWIGHLEMAYGSASGSPPAVRNANTPATEIVFSRERMRFDTPTTNDGSCAGVYTIRTPFNVHEFDLAEGGRALFYTDDIQPINGNYSAALEGHAGPFFTWDVGQNGVDPVSSANPAVTITPPVGPLRKYVGDPNVPHTFVGSTLPAGPGHVDKVFNNYVEITPPQNCDLGAGAGTPVFEENAAVSGLMWDLPIADPVTVTKATYTRDAASVGLDVWATASKDQHLVLTAADNSTQQVPSTVLVQEIKDGNKTGIYHAHLEFDPAQTLPNQISVTNMSSNPVVTDKAAVVDEIVITKSTYDSASRKLCIAAHSGDETNPVPLRLEAPGYGSFTDPTGNCTGVAGNDKVLDVDLDDFADNHLPPQGVLIKSDKGGQETSQPSIIRDGNLDATNNIAVDDSFDNIQGTGTTGLDLTGPAFDNSPNLKKETASADNAPANFRVVVISQPVNGSGEQLGTITAPVNGGTVTYAAKEGMDASELTFYYAIQDTTNNTVSNVARVDLSVDKTVPPPVGVADRQGVFRTTLGATIRVLDNDVTGLSNTPIDPTSILFANGSNTAQVLRGVTVVGNVTANANGTVTYAPQNQGATANNTIDTFTYTVANTAGARSTPITVQVALKTAQEAVQFQRVRWTGSRWDIRFTSTYAGVAGAITLAPTAQCVLSGNPGANGNIGGPVSPGAGTNAYVNVANAPAASGNAWTVTCNTSSGGSGFRQGQL